MAFSRASNWAGHPFGIIALLLFALLGLHGIYFGGKAALADAITLEPRSNLDMTGAVGNPQQWSEYQKKLLQGLKWAPENTDILEHLGLLYLGRALAHPDASGAKNDLQLALVNYRRAAALRPMSPYPWCNIAYILNRLDSDPAMIWSAFDQAMAYGRNEYGIQTILAEIGYARHVALLPARRQALIQVFERSSGSLRTALLAVAQKNAVDPQKL